MLRDNKYANHPSATSGHTSSTRNTTTTVVGISGKLKSPYFYTLASIVILTILSILILNFRLSLANATGSEGSNDTGIATLSRVGITQAGTGQSVTIDGTTLDEEGENNEVDNAKRRTILNNNVVRYRADLQVSTPGSLTLSITLPANNTIDEATIGSAQGCIAGSKLEAVTVDGKKSYTNNKATCVMNATSIGQVSWGITAYLWGGNNTKIQPTISLSGIAQSQKPDPITVVGKANYGMAFTNGDDGRIVNGINYSVIPSFGIYAKVDDNKNGGLGIAPLEEDIEFIIDTSSLPSGWYVSNLWTSYRYITGSGGKVSSMVHSGSLSTEKLDGGNALKVVWRGAVTGAKHCPTRQTTSSETVDKTKCFYTGATISIASPMSSLTSEQRGYKTAYSQFTTKLIGGGETVISPDVQSQTWTMSNKAYGNPVVVGGSAHAGWKSFWDNNYPVYTGESLTIDANISMSAVTQGSTASNLQYCVAWSPAQYTLSSDFTWNKSTVSSSYSVQYGIIGTDMSILPSSSQQYCGKYGDTNIENQRMFFNTLEEANAYAKQHNLKVNAMRLWSKEVKAGIRDVTVGQFKAVTVGRSEGVINATMSAAAITDQWNARNQSNNAASSDTPAVRTYKLIPGLLSHTITAVPSSNAPNTTDHVTITPKTYNRDTNVKITTTLPEGLTYQSGSFRVGSHQLSQGLDYDIARQSDGSTVITFNMDQIASIPGLEDIVGEPAIMPGEPGNDTDLPIAKDNNGNGIVRDAIEFDVLVDSNVPTPSTLTITSQVSGTGTNYAASTFRAASTSVTISQARVFGYNLTSSASSLNVNEDLTYTYSNYNLTDDDITNLDTISVLPFNNDSRGSYGLTSYNLSGLTIASSDKDLSLPTIYYTTDPKVRELEQSDPAELATNDSISWTKCNLDSQGNCTNLPSESTSGDADAPADGGVTAVRWQLPNFAKGAQYYINLTINDLDAESAAKLANDITYVSADGVVTATHQSPTTTSYVGESLGLRMDTTNLVATLNPNDATTLTNHLTILSNTRHGYNLTINMAGDSNGLVSQSSGRTIPAINTKPQSGTPGWSISTDNSEWQAVPTATGQGLLLYSNAQSGQTTTNLPVTYGFSTTESTVADTYQGQVVYTLVGI